jgi:protein kinase-like protein
MKALAADDPRVIGEYRLQTLLGQGGMGRVYLGLSPAGRAVAIKVVRSDLARDTEFLRRFGQEVAAARAVSGIYTAPVVASGLDETPPWLATAFVPGPSLDQVVTEHGPLPEPALWPLLAGLVEALQAIHACGVVHRDLKPANVLLAADGPRVIDFGISRAADGTALTAAGVVFGTPGYMSPEQAEGMPAGPASDVFALGCVMAYAAGGAGPFGTGTAAAVLYRVVHAEAALNGMPPRLREIVSGCLAKDPAARPAPRALSALIAGHDLGTGPSAVAFWPRSVGNLIGAYQARLEQETSGRPGDGTVAHPPTTLSNSGPRLAAAPGLPGAPGQAGAAAPMSGWPSQPPLHAAGSPAYPGGTQPYPPDSPAYTGPAGSPGYSPPQGYGQGPGYPAPQGYGGAPGPAGYSGAPGPAGYSGAPGPAGYSGAPGPAGYSGAPGPAGYGGAPGPQAPRGYGPGGPSGYPQPYQAAPPVPLTPPPTPAPPSVMKAVRLMYAGAAFTGLEAVGIIIVAAALVKKHNATIATTGHTTGLGGVVAITIFFGLIEIGLWLGIAQACRNGKNWARITGTVLFGLHTLAFLDVITNKHAGLGPAKLLTAVGWLIACGAVVFLWQRPSGDFFKTRALRR